MSRLSRYGIRFVPEVQESLKIMRRKSHATKANCSRCSGAKMLLLKAAQSLHVLLTTHITHYY